MERSAAASRKADSLSDNNAALLRSHAVVLEANTALEAANRALVDANRVLLSSSLLLSSLELSDTQVYEPYTSPPRNRFTFLRSSCS